MSDTSRPRATKAPYPRFNLAIERLFMSGMHASPQTARTSSCFNLAIERLFMSGATEPTPYPLIRATVSISQSRCLSFQVTARVSRRFSRSAFQSRHRDAFHFRSAVSARLVSSSMFQSRNRDACHFRSPDNSRKRESAC